MLRGLFEFSMVIIAFGGLEEDIGRESIFPRASKIFTLTSDGGTHGVLGCMMFKPFLKFPSFCYQLRILSTHLLKFSPFRLACQTHHVTFNDAACYVFF
jgi:hypothetical protein